MHEMNEFQSVATELQELCPDVVFTVLLAESSIDLFLRWNLDQLGFVAEFPKFRLHAVGFSLEELRGSVLSRVQRMRRAGNFHFPVFQQL